MSALLTGGGVTPALRIASTPNGGVQTPNDWGSSQQMACSLRGNWAYNSLLGGQKALINSRNWGFMPPQVDSAGPEEETSLVQDLMPRSRAIQLGLPPRPKLVPGLAWAPVNA